MSAEATAYVTSLRECPDGAELSCTQKCILYCLADHHNRSTRRCDPSLKLIAEESLIDKSTVIANIRWLELHCLLEVVRESSPGAGDRNRYLLLAVDDPERLRALLAEKAQGLAGTPLFSSPQRVEKGSDSPPKRVGKGLDSPPRNKEVEPGTKSNHRTITAGAALTVWLAVKRELEKQLPEPEVALWVTPARLQRTLSACHMLIALPPSNRIIQAAHQRITLLRSLLAPHGYNASFTKYADDYDREEHLRRYGKEVQDYGHKPVRASPAGN